MFEIRRPDTHTSMQKTRGHYRNETATDDLPGEAELAFWHALAGPFLATMDDFEYQHDAVREPATEKCYNLSERTAQFGENVIRFAKSLPFNPVNNRIIEQFVGSGTSIGANYCEANDSVSPKDFRHRISICRKESKETRFWLRMLATAEPSRKDEARVLWCEATELNLIFGSIWRKSSH